MDSRQEWKNGVLQRLLSDQLFAASVRTLIQNREWVLAMPDRSKTQNAERRLNPSTLRLRKKMGFFLNRCPEQGAHTIGRLFDAGKLMLKTTVPLAALVAA
jgi:hypothetical protein